MPRIFIALVCSTALLCACADDESTAAITCVDYGTVTPGASLSDDLMPLFARSCALATSCHQGDAGEGTEDLGLGPNTDNSPAPAAVITGIRDQLVNQAPTRSPLPFINPGKPNESWLMAKVTYDSAGLAQCAQCSGEGCGVYMPQGSSPDGGTLSPAERELIAAWILDGAQDN